MRNATKWGAARAVAVVLQGCPFQSATPAIWSTASDDQLSATLVSAASTIDAAWGVAISLVYNGALSEKQAVEAQKYLTTASMAVQTGEALYQISTRPGIDPGEQKNILDRVRDELRAAQTAWRKSKAITDKSPTPSVPGSEWSGISKRPG